MADNNENVRKPIDPATRERLQKLFQFGVKALAGNQFDYAVDMFSQCVSGDPGNLIYVQNLLGALQRKYNNNKKGGSFASIKGAGAKTGMANAARKKDWPGVIKSGVEFLKLNPWDAAALASMSDASGEMGYGNCQIAYLKAALEADMKDVELNRKLARALDAESEFEQAIVCWRRVQAVKPDDDEARRGIADASVRNTIKKAKYEEAESTQDVRDDDPAAANRISPEQQLIKAIAKKPGEIGAYIELAELYQRQEDFDKAEETLNKALQVSGGDVMIHERLEDARLRRIRENTAVAEKRAKEQPSPENEKRLQRCRIELNNCEMEVYRQRSERYPANLLFKYELGLRLQLAGNAPEAIKVLQEARADPQRKGEVLLALGECFQQIKQYKLAMSNYQQALEEIGGRNQEMQKRALYRAGKLALGLKEYDEAEKLLTDLAGIDFSYRDVPELLDKIRRKREEEEPMS